MDCGASSPPSGSDSWNYFESVGFNKQQLYAVSYVEGFRVWNLDGATPVLVPNPTNTVQLASYTTYAPAPDSSGVATIEDVSGTGTLSIWSSADTPRGAARPLGKTVWLSLECDLPSRMVGCLAVVTGEGKLDTLGHANLSM